VKDRLTNFTVWLAAVGSLLLLLYFLASPLIFLDSNKGPAASPLLLKLAGPVVGVLESDFRGPLLSYFKLWGIQVAYNAREPSPQPPWYAAPAYVVVSVLCSAALAYPLWRSRHKNSCTLRRTKGLSR
jgi:hypothetical protein